MVVKILKNLFINMSRAKAKLARVHDLQCRHDVGDVILTKKDCDMIAHALDKTYQWSEIKELYIYFKHLTRK